MDGPGHVVEKMRRGLIRLGLTPNKEPFRRFTAPRRLEGPVVLSPKSALDVKDWSPDRWQILTESLDAVGIQWEWETKGSLWTLEDQLHRSSLVVGVDSGPLHLADYMGIPVIGLYGYTTPDLHGPLGPRAEVHYDPKGVNHIDPLAVADSVQKKINA